MNPLLPRVRASVKPAGLHLVLSATVALFALGLIYWLWYPGELAAAQGVSKLVLILIGVDVMIGPLITLIVYAPGKKSLSFDLAVIAALQTTALLYGMQAIHGGRPAFVVFSVDRFDVVAYADVDRDSLQRAAPEMRISPWGPKWTGARMPDDPQKRSDILFSAFNGGADLQHMPEYYLPLHDLRGEMLRHHHPLDELRRINELDDAAWNALLADLGRTEAELGYLPVVANAKDGAMILDLKTGEILGLRLLEPDFSAPRNAGDKAGPAAKPAPETAPDAVPGAPAPSPAPRPAEPMSRGVG